MKTTQKHFDFFKKKFLEYADLFGLKRYRFDFIHEKLRPGYAAQIDTSLNNMTARISFNSERNDTLTYEIISRDAFHEACELLLARLNGNAHTRFLYEHELIEASHEVIRTLEKVFYKEGKNARSR